MVWLSDFEFYQFPAQMLSMTLFSEHTLKAKHASTGKFKIGELYHFLQSPFKNIGHHITSPIQYF